MKSPLIGPLILSGLRESQQLFCDNVAGSSEMDMSAGRKGVKSNFWEHYLMDVKQDDDGEDSVDVKLIRMEWSKIMMGRTQSMLN